MYKITFNMQTAICFIDRPIFDSIIAYAYMKELEGKNFTQKLHIPQNELFALEDLPLKMHPDGYLLASYMFWDSSKEVEYTGSWKKRWDSKNDDLADFGKKKRQIRVNAGPYKSYDMPMNLHHIPEVWFYFDTDNIDEIERLVSKWVFGMGKKRSQGYGEIKSFKIENADIDFETGGCRPVPITEDKFFELLKNENTSLSVTYTGYRPPYWLPENQTYCLC